MPRRKKKPIEPVTQVLSEQPGTLQGRADFAAKEPERGRLLLYSLAALGVVYADLGTNPLFAIRISFSGRYALPPAPANVLGVLSIVFWSLLILVTIKYTIYIMRADNEGEGGILALTALVTSRQRPRRRPGRKTIRWLILPLGLFGAALLYGDGIVTPAISVLSAAEGLELAAPGLRPYVAAVAVAVLFFLFLLQRVGTAGIGAIFGPLMAAWFLAIAALGLPHIWTHPEVLAAVNPAHAVRLFQADGWAAFRTLGTIFLAVAGGEALYADMGHFGRRPIRLTWYGLVLPALLLNYFGQGALLLRTPEAAAGSFYLLAPRWALIPAIGLATAATFIASQAIISGAFSLTRQAVLLGELPRLRIVQTSPAQVGQIYIPVVNWILMAATIALVLGFRRSASLSGAYVVAVSTIMVITTVLAFFVTRSRWRWGAVPAALVLAGFLAIELPFFASALLQVPQSGWAPLALGVIGFVLMGTWKRGRAAIERRAGRSGPPLAEFVERIRQAGIIRVPGTAIFMTGHRGRTPALLEHHLRQNHMLHERAVLLTVLIEEVPRVPAARRLELVDLGHGIYTLTARFGFMEPADVRRALQEARRLGLELDPDRASYFVSRKVAVSSGADTRPDGWRDRLFAFLARNASDPIAFYGLPPDRVSEVGIRVEV